ERYGIGRPSMRKVTPSGRPGFTLIELLVVVAIIALLIAILLPSLARAKEQGKIAACLANLKAIGVAAASYEADQKKSDFPWALHDKYVVDGKSYSWKWTSEFIWGGGMPDFDYVNKSWPYGDASKPTFADVLKIPPKGRPMNKYFAP